MAQRPSTLTTKPTLALLQILENSLNTDFPFIGKLSAKKPCGHRFNQGK